MQFAIKTKQKLVNLKSRWLVGAIKILRFPCCGDKSNDRTGSPLAELMAVVGVQEVCDTKL